MNSKFSYLLKSITIFLLLGSIYFLFNNNFSLSFTYPQNIDSLVSSKSTTSVVKLAEKTSLRRDVLLALYADKENPEHYYLAEFSKLLLFPIYSLQSIQELNCSDDLCGYFSAVTSPLRHYAYEVSANPTEIQIFENDVSGFIHQNENMIHSLLYIGSAILLNIVAFLYLKKPGK